MSEESLTLYKLMMLYMLDNLDFPLTTSQLSEFFVTHGYTSYFHMQQAVNELAESAFIRGEMIRNTTHYYLTENGREALQMFESKYRTLSKTIFSIILKNTNISSARRSISPRTITR